MASLRFTMLDRRVFPSRIPNEKSSAPVIANDPRCQIRNTDENLPRSFHDGITSPRQNLVQVEISEPGIVRVRSCGGSRARCDRANIGRRARGHPHAKNSAIETSRFLTARSENKSKRQRR